MKNKFEDIIPPEKRSIRNIPLPTRDERARQGHPSMDGIHSAPRAVHHAPKQEAPVKHARKHVVKEAKIEEVQDDLFEGSEGAGKSRWKMWAFLVVVIVAAIYFLSSYFAHADINISLARHDMELSDRAIPLEKIHYTVVTADISKNASVQANGFQKVSKYAKGTVVIYNSSNTVPQKLAINTRLETSDGHIFKIDNPVTIPAITMSGSKKLAGSVTVDVTADKPGTEYNLGLKDFTIPGFKGTDNYSILYARSKTPLAGGFVGNMPDINQKDLDSTAASLKKAIGTEINKTVISKVADAAGKKDDYIYIPNALVVDYTSPDVQQSADGKSANVTLSAKATAMAISNSSLSAFLIQSDTMPQSDPESNTDKINATYSGDYSKVILSLPSNITAKALALSANQTNPGITATASGTASIASGIDTEAVTSAVSHLSRQQAIEIIKNIVDFSMIEVSIKPWWMSTLPDAANIRINIEK